MKRFCSITLLTLILTCMLSPSTVFGQAEPDSLDYFEMSLEELMDIKISVASTKALTSRESPGIVTLVTSEEIANSGARDLIDVLRLVPGFEFGVDVQGVVGVGLRGNWGHEGKILILLDGQEMNERNYATTQLGHHFPVEQIDRIEIIRGPGSAIYGGYAELGVVNIITKKANLNGGSISGTYGQMSETLGRAQGSFALGKSFDDLAIDFKGFVLKGNRSDKDYVDIYGDSYSMKDNSEISTMMLNTGLKFRGFNVRLIYEDHTIQERDLFDAAMPDPVDMDFKGFYGEVKYDWILAEGITLKPRFSFKRQQPWRSNSNTAFVLDTTDYEGVFSDKVVTQTLGSVALDADVSSEINFIAGIEYYQDEGETVIDYEYAFNNSTSISFTNFSAYAQGLFKLNFANITVGARYNDHEQFGSAFVPRVGLTKVFNKFHSKILFSQAFRTPSIENIDPNPAIEPELTTVFEVEAGYRLTDKMFLTANLYLIDIDEPIVYFYDGVTDEEGYSNFAGTGTQGLEFEYKYKDSWGTITLNYSNYSANGNNEVDSYNVPGDDNQLLGFAQSKFNLFGNFKFTKQLSFSPSLTYLSERSGFFTVDINDDPVLGTFDAELFVNAYFRYQNLFMEGLHLGVGVFNLTDNDYAFIQPYNSGHAPLPAPSREIVVRLNYNFNF